ncbi:hypothetical protein ACEWY4_011792 [Coilia grayii]|uniref:Transcription termination factor 1-like n=1 Tax=Coilia grayii TaxID=363190 RepID=A0ABD1JYQ7_9TELE
MRHESVNASLRCFLNITLRNSLTHQEGRVSCRPSEIFSGKSTTLPFIVVFCPTIAELVEKVFLRLSTDPTEVDPSCIDINIIRLHVLPTTDLCSENNPLEVTMMEAELVVHKKKKRSKKRLAELPEPSNTHQRTYEEIRVDKKHKKKKNTKGHENDDDSRPAEVNGDMGEGKIKRKRKRKGEKANVTSVVMGESVDSISQVREVTRKKRRIEDTEHDVGNTEEVTLTTVQTNGQAAQQEPVKSKSKKVRKSADSQVIANASLATDTQLYPEEMLSESFALNIDKAILQEIKEYLPQRGLTHKRPVQGIILYDLPRFREFKKQGIAVRMGKWTMAESKRLKQNVRDFLALSGIESEAKLFKPHRFPEERNAIMRQRKKLGFIMFLSEGIPRPWLSVWLRARNVFDEQNYMGRFTDEENQTLLELHRLHGSKWSTISDKMGRSQRALQKRFDLFAEGHGSWTEAEFRTLLTSVQQQLLKRAMPVENGSIGLAVIRKVDLYKKLSWMSVAKQVQTRNFLQCRKKWMDYLINKMKTGGVIKGRKSLEGQIQLIKVINEMAVEDAADIVWDDLTHLFGNTHPDYLRMRFYQLKVTHVPGWNRMMDFCEVIDYLYEKTLPKLEEELKSCKEDEEPTEERDSYKLSEIFPDL